MTKDEIIHWIKTSKHIVTDYSEYDSNGNHYARDIFEHDGELYSVEYCNGEVMEELNIDANNRVTGRGVYLPRRVIGVKKLVEEMIYEYVDPN